MNARRYFRCCGNCGKMSTIVGLLPRLGMLLVTGLWDAGVDMGGGWRARGILVGEVDAGGLGRDFWGGRIRPSRTWIWGQGRDRSATIPHHRRIENSYEEGSVSLAQVQPRLEASGYGAPWHKRSRDALQVPCFTDASAAFDLSPSHCCRSTL